MVSILSTDERVALVAREQPSLPLQVQAELLSVSRASLSYQPKPPSAEEVALKRRIDKICTKHPFLGSRKIARPMQGEGHRICRNTVALYMQQMRIAAIYPGPNLRKRNSDHAVYPYLLRGIKAARPNHISRLRYGTAIRAAISPVRSTLSACWRKPCGSAWTAKGALWIISSLSDMSFSA